MKRQVRCKGAHVRIAGEMTIYTAADLHAQMLAAINKRRAARLLDLSEVTEFDTAGLQIVLVAQRQASALGRQLRIVKASPAVHEVFDLLHLRHLTSTPAEGNA
jgi:anti-anti-sigma factor